MATVRLHTQAEPSELPLVLLPPFPLDHRAWADVAERLGGDVITVDPPGFGGDADDEPSLEAYAQALLAALDDRNVGRFVVAGNSMGGYVAMCLAETSIQRIGGVGLFGTKSVADAEKARADRLEMAEGAEGGAPASELLDAMKGKLLGPTSRSDRPEVVSTVESLADAAPAEGIAWAQRAMAVRPDRTEILRSLAVPAVVVHGVEDPLMDEASQDTMASALGVKVVEIEHAGHLLPLEAPDACVEALADLWERARAAHGAPA